MDISTYVQCNAGAAQCTVRNEYVTNSIVNDGWVGYTECNCENDIVADKTTVLSASLY